MICSLEGVPSTLIISTSWSTPLSPGNMGCPRRSSARTHPADQTSTFFKLNHSTRYLRSLKRFSDLSPRQSLYLINMICTFVSDISLTNTSLFIRKLLRKHHNSSQLLAQSPKPGEYRSSRRIVILLRLHNHINTSFLMYWKNIWMLIILGRFLLHVGHKFKAMKK